MAIIHHGTPLTPRNALIEVCKGRAMCVSFFRPDDVEAVEAISPSIMFRQRRIFILEDGSAQGRRLAREMGLGGLLHMARTTPFLPRTVGGHPGYAGCALPAQRRAAPRVAFRAKRSASLAHGRANRTAASTVRDIRPGLLGLDRCWKVHRLPRLSPANERSRSGFRKSLASDPHDARNSSCIRLPLSQRGQHIAGGEWMAL